MQRLTQHLMGMIRVAVFGAAILACVAGVTLHKAEAKLAESLRGFGDELAAVPGFSPHSAPREILFNGLALKMFSASTPLEVPAALDRFQSLCHSVGQIELPEAVRRRLADNVPNGSIPSLGTIRRDSDSEGFIGCIDLGSRLDGEGLLGRLKEFGTTYNLRALGQLRYAQARRTHGKTTLIVYWTEGDTKLKELFPKDGDAAGRDLVDVPRPPASQRRFSAFESGMPYGIAGYAIPRGGQSKILESYGLQLRDEGWRTFEPKNNTFIAEKAGRRVLVGLSAGQGEKTILSLFDLG
jgi:hypothetical protein